MIYHWIVILYGRDPGAPNYEFTFLKEALDFAGMFKPSSYKIAINLNDKTITVK